VAGAVIKAFESLRFYESGRSIPSLGNRRYSTYFPQSIARYIYFEINVCSIYRLGAKVYQVKWRYYNPTGSLEWEKQDDWNIRADLSYCYFSRGYGWNKTGNWTPGTYRVEILIDGVEFAEGSFSIEHPG
jgi:hypothetical protein